MLTTKREPTSAGEILIEEFMDPMGLTQDARRSDGRAAQTRERTAQ